MHSAGTVAAESAEKNPAERQQPKPLPEGNLRPAEERRQHPIPQTQHYLAANEDKERQANGSEDENESPSPSPAHVSYHVSVPHAFVNSS
jgi:hypothetical protein